MIEVQLWNLTTVRIYWKASMVVWAVVLFREVMMNILPWTL